MSADPRLGRAEQGLIGLVLVATGAAALIAQVTWQRTIGLYVGVDVEASATVVAAFLGGLGLGNLAGGPLADRLDRRGALLALAGATAVLAALTFGSVYALVEGYRAAAPHLEGLAARLAFNGVVLLAPTFLQGLAIPLLARVVASDADRAASEIAGFNAANTLGAAFGAFAGAWVLVGHYGADGAARLAALLQLSGASAYLLLATAGRHRAAARLPVMARWAAGLGVIGGSGAALGLLTAALPKVAPAWPVGAVAGLALGGVACRVTSSGRRPESADPVAPPSSTASQPADESAAAAVPSPSPSPTPALQGGRAWPWYVLYGLTGAVALGYEQVAFRLLGGLIRSNSYTFGHVLSLYLVLLAVGGALGVRLRRRALDDRRTFLWLQATAGLGMAGSVLVVTKVLPEGVLAEDVARWTERNGLAGGFSALDLRSGVIFGVVLPLLLLAVPVLCQGASFPFVQGVVIDGMASVGNRTGRLLAANLVGNVAGTVVTGFVLLDRLGTIGAVRVLAAPLLVLGVVAAGLGEQRARRLPAALATVVVAGLLLMTLPSSPSMWRGLFGGGAARFSVAEDRSCVASLIHDRPELGSTASVQINGAVQNGYPFDAFHVLIGLLPSLVHDDPDRSLAVGFGAGSTSYALLADPRAGSVTSVELCAGTFTLADQLADEGLAEFQVLAEDARHQRVIGDGRRLLLDGDDPYDVVVPDALLPTSAGSGNLYSQEFQELVNHRLADDGIAAGWVPTVRARNAVSSTFPYVVALTVESYSDSTFTLASRSPIRIDRSEVLARFDDLAADRFEPALRAELRAFLVDLQPECVNDGRTSELSSAADVNRDLHPRDEYFLNNVGLLDDAAARTCGP